MIDRDSASAARWPPVSLSRLRVQLLLATKGLAVVAVLALLGVAALSGAGWFYTHPDTASVTDRTTVSTVHSSVSESAVVTGSSSLYPVGTQLRDQVVYPLEAAPVATLSLVTHVPEGRGVSVDQRLELRHRAVHDGTAFWSDSRTLARTDATTDDGLVRTITTFNVSAYRERRSELSASVGDAGSIRSTLVYRVDYDTGRYSGAFNQSLAVDTGSNWYSFGTNPTEREHTETSKRTVVTARNDGLAAGLAVLGLLCLFGAAAAFRGTRRHQAGDPDSLRRRLEAARHADWVSKGSLAEVGGEREITVATLPDLVDVAIDTERRVIHDAERRVYAVVDGATVYRYDYDPDESASRWEWADSDGKQ